MAVSRIVIFGYDELLLASLEFFARAKTEISAVVFPSNRTDWRALKIRETVAEKGLATLEQPPRKTAGDFVERVRALHPELIFVWSYPMILPAEIVKLPKHGALNLHMGLLPEYRGVNGIRQALINGEDKTGVTIHLMDEGVDTGPIVARAAFPIAPADDIRSLMIKSRQAGLYLLENCWPQIKTGRFDAAPQDEKQARYYSAADAARETIDWSRPNHEIHNLIRASALPFPGVQTVWNERRLTLRQSQPIEIVADVPAGTVTKIDDHGLEIATGRGSLLVTAVEIEGEAATPAKLREAGLQAGDRLFG